MLKSDGQKEAAKEKAGREGLNVAEEKGYAAIGQGPWYIFVDDPDNPGVRKAAFSGADMAAGWELLDSLREDGEWAGLRPAMWSPAMALAHMRRHEVRALKALLKRAEVSRFHAESVAAADDDHVVVLGGLAIGAIGGLQTQAELAYLNRLVKCYVPAANLLARHGLVEPANAIGSVARSDLVSLP